MAAPSSKKSNSKKQKVINLEHYVPGYLTWISNKLSSGASQAYLSTFSIGIETWRLLVLLASDGTLSAPVACKVIGMDKASVSRCFKTMQQDGLITMSLDDSDGRLRIANLTAKGRKIHDQILGLALERERALLEVLNDKEQETLVQLLARIHENLPTVESATENYIRKNFKNK